MKKLFIYFILLISISGCSKKESEFNDLKTINLYGEWILSTVKSATVEGDTIIFSPEDNSNVLNLQKGGVYTAQESDYESMIQLSPSSFPTIHKPEDLGLWEFPVEATPNQILFDKGVNTYYERDYYDDYYMYKNMKDPDHLYNIESNDKTLKLSTTDPEKAYNYGFRMMNDYFYYNYYVYASSTYDEGFSWGELAGYYLGFHEGAADFYIENEMEEYLFQDPFYNGLSDGVAQYDYNYPTYTDAQKNDEFEAGFVDGYLPAYDKGFNDAQERASLKKESFILTLEFIRK